MRSTLLAAALSVAVVAPVAVPQAAAAQSREDRWRDREERRAERQYRRNNDYRWGGNRSDWDPQRAYRSGNYRERRLGRNDQVYRGRDGRYYCKRNDGTTGLVIGAIGGGVLGNVLGGKTLGTIIGAGAGGLLGREVDRGKVRCR